MTKDKTFSDKKIYVIFLFIGILIVYFLRFQYGTGTIKDMYGVLQGLSVEQQNQPSYISILYVGIVRQLFLFLGLKNQVVIVFQVLVTLLSSFFLFLSAKKISNQETALITTAIYTLFPTTMNACLYFDGMVLFELFMCIGFYFCISFFVKLIHAKEKQTSLIVLAIITGLIIGIFQFLDVSFFSLFLMLQLTFLLIAKKTKEQRTGFSLKITYFLQFFSYLAGLFLTIFLKAYASASTIKIVSSNIMFYFESLLFKPDHSVFAAVTFQKAIGVISYNIYVWVNAMHLNNETYWFLGSTGNAVIAGILFILVLASFVVVKQNRLFRIFFPFGLLFLSFIMCLFLPFTYELQGIMKTAIIMLSVMAGGFIGTIFFAKQIKIQTEGADPMNSIFGATKEVEKKAVSLQDLEANDTREQKTLDGIKYIDNPLPVPKRHEKKTMDYDMVIPDSKMNYDLKTYKDNDDYDLK